MLQLNLSPVSEPAIDLRAGTPSATSSSGNSAFADVINEQSKPLAESKKNDKTSEVDASEKRFAEETADTSSSLEKPEKSDGNDVSVTDDSQEDEEKENGDVGLTEGNVDFLQHLQSSLAVDTNVRALAVPSTALSSQCEPSSVTDAEDDASLVADISGGKKLPPIAAGHDCLSSDSDDSEQQGLVSRQPVTDGQLIRSAEELGDVDDEAGLATAQGGMRADGGGGIVAEVSSKPGSDASSSRQTVTIQSTSAEQPDKGALASFFSTDVAGTAEETVSSMATTSEATTATETAPSSDKLSRTHHGGKLAEREGAIPSPNSESQAVEINNATVTTTDGGLPSQSISGQLSGTDGAADGSDGTANLIAAMENKGAPSRTATSASMTAESGTAGSKASELYRELASVDMSSHLKGSLQLAERLTLMIGQKWHEAELELEPQGLGKMQIQLSIGQDQQASVQFVVQQQSSRDAVEQTLPKLREMLAQQGIHLTQSTVQQQSQQQSQGNSAGQWSAQSGEQGGKGGNAHGQNGKNGAEAGSSVQNLLIQRSEDTGIDFYA